MKRCIMLALLLCYMIAIFAQAEVTKFLGIPIDGTKSAMIEKLKAKGFTYDSEYDWLEGEFNGEEVIIRVVTNNRKVWRICIGDLKTRSEGQIRIRYNELISQFEKNSKYEKATLSDYTLTEDEDISYEITVHDKQYQAAYIQIPPKQETDNSFEEDVVTNMKQRLDAFTYNRVWFSISESKYGEYRIFLYYDNERNHAQGEDL